MTDQASPFTPFAPLQGTGPAPAAEPETTQAPKKRGPRRNTAAAAEPAAPKKRGRPAGSGKKTQATNGAKPAVKAAPAPAAQEATTMNPLDALHHVSTVLDKVHPRDQPKVMAFLNKMFG